MDRSKAGSSSQPQHNSIENISEVALSHWDVKFADVLSTDTFEANKWKTSLDSVHRYHVVFRLLWINRIMELLRKESNTRDQMKYLVDLLLGFEDRTWNNSEEELQYILNMEKFPAFSKRADHATWPELLGKGRCMELLKDVLRFQLVDALPTIFWVDKHLNLFLLLGSQHRPEIQALFHQLTLALNKQLLQATPRRAPLRLAPLPPHRILKETMDLAFGAVYTPGAALSVLEGILSPTGEPPGLAFAKLPAPLEEYLRLLWHKEVHYSSVLRHRLPVSQNVLKLGLPWMSCSRCSQAKDVGTLFALRATEANVRFVPDVRIKMDDVLARIEFFRRLFQMMKVIVDLNRTLEHTPLVCRHRQIAGPSGR